MKLKDIEVVKWSQVSAQFQQLFPDVYDECDRVFKKHAAEFYLAHYPFGTHPVEAGRLKVPYLDKLHDVNSADLPEELQTELTYPHRTTPICAIMQGTIEAYIGLPHHLIPLWVLKAGQFFGLNGLFQEDRNSHIVFRAYNWSSGSRSALILAKISHEQYNERLAKHYTIDKKYLCPKTFVGQWNLFRELAQSPEFKNPWESTLLIVPRKTYNLLAEDSLARHVLLDRLYQKNVFAQNQVVYDLIWSIFFEKLSTGIKNAASILETVKHVIKIAMSEALGYHPVVNDEQGPFREFTNIFLNVYRIRYYLPAFVELGHFNRHDPIYYSLQKHNFFCNIPEKGGTNRTIDELIAIKRLLLSFKQHVLEGKFPFSLEDTVLFKTLQEVEFDFYHPHGTAELNTNIESIIAEDSRLMQMLQNMEYDKSLDFPIHSLFFNGCIRIRPAKKVNKPTMKDLLGPAGFANFRLDDKE